MYFTQVCINNVILEASQRLRFNHLLVTLQAYAKNLRRHPRGVLIEDPVFKHYEFPTRHFGNDGVEDPLPFFLDSGEYAPAFSR